MQAANQADGNRPNMASREGKPGACSAIELSTSTIEYSPVELSSGSSAHGKLTPSTHRATEHAEDSPCPVGPGHCAGVCSTSSESSEATEPSEGSPPTFGARDYDDTTSMSTGGSSVDEPNQPAEMGIATGWGYAGAPLGPRPIQAAQHATRLDDASSDDFTSDDTGSDMSQTSEEASTTSSSCCPSCCSSSSCGSE